MDCKTLHIIEKTASVPLCDITRRTRGDGPAKAPSVVYSTRLKYPIRLRVLVSDIVKVAPTHATNTTRWTP